MHQYAGTCIGRIGRDRCVDGSAQYPVGEAALWVMHGDEMTRAYYYARIWAVPAGILLFGFNGWFTGMQNAVIPMCTAITVNIIHVACSSVVRFRARPRNRRYRLCVGVSPMDGCRACTRAICFWKFPPHSNAGHMVGDTRLAAAQDLFTINRDIILEHSASLLSIPFYGFFRTDG